jgi:hypothetical protein
MKLSTLYEAYLGAKMAPKPYIPKKIPRAGMSSPIQSKITKFIKAAKKARNAMNLGSIREFANTANLYLDALKERDVDAAKEVIFNAKNLIEIYNEIRQIPENKRRAFIDNKIDKIKELYKRIINVLIGASAKQGIDENIVGEFKNLLIESTNFNIIYI